MRYSAMGRLKFPQQEGNSCWTFTVSKSGEWKVIESTVKSRETMGFYKYLYETRDYAEIALKIHLGRLKRYGQTSTGE